MSVSNVRNFFAKISLRNLDKRMKILLSLFFLLQIVDIALTFYVVSLGGLEINFFAAWAVYGGLVPMIFMKLAVVAFIVMMVCYIFPFLNEQKKSVVHGVYSGLVLWYFFIAVWNIEQLLRVIQ